GVAYTIAPAEGAGPGGGGRELQDLDAVGDHVAIGRTGAIPFEHGELGMVQRSALAVAPDMAEAGDAGLARRQQLLHGEFRRGVEVEPLPGPVIADGGGGKGVKMRLVARRELQPRR